MNATQSQLYLVLGRALVSATPPKDQLLSILNDVWKVPGAGAVKTWISPTVAHRS
jgi:hypothetical protein